MDDLRGWYFAIRYYAIRYLVLRYFAYFTFCDLIFCDFDIPRFRYFATLIFCFRYVAFNNLRFYILLFDILSGTQAKYSSVFRSEGTISPFRSCMYILMLRRVARLCLGLCSGSDSLRQRGGKAARWCVLQKSAKLSIHGVIFAWPMASICWVYWCWWVYDQWCNKVNRLIC